ncbi:transcriptional regulator, TetR family [Duganella sacchari]|uniref:Transcriptional regulator, TetR family n=1 Tax=Duganella sacchari TaxID=551987 RepID=A0A1M7QXU7_9BURK|nr:TetR/AcrR family transcriptional regulator [Duganella sacchari]SHN36952.1 transcriptional regulator, TetR family [Duganella sacchari]
MAKANVKEQIVSTSLNLLHSKGFNATSVQDITDAAGVPKGSFYNHFTSKEALGLEVLQRYVEGAAQIAAILSDSTLPPLARIQQFYARMIAANTVNDYNFGCLMGNFSAELSNQIPAMRAAMQENYAASTALMADVIAQGQQDGNISNTLPAATLAGFVTDAWQGAVLRAKADHSIAPLERFAQVVLQHLLR